MRLNAFVLRLIAVVMVPFAICQTFGPLWLFGRSLSLAFGTIRSGDAGTMFLEETRELTISLALLSVPLVLWRLADVADGTKSVPPKKPENSK